MIGLRNRLIHEYLRMDTERLVKFLGFLNDFRDFARVIEPYL